MNYANVRRSLIASLDVTIGSRAARRRIFMTRVQALLQSQIITNEEALKLLDYQPPLRFR